MRYSLKWKLDTWLCELLQIFTDHTQVAIFKGTLMMIFGKTFTRTVMHIAFLKWLVTEILLWYSCRENLNHSLRWLKYFPQKNQPETENDQTEKYLNWKQCLIEGSNSQLQDVMPKQVSHWSLQSKSSELVMHAADFIILFDKSCTSNVNPQYNTDR